MSELPNDPITRDTVNSLDKINGQLPAKDQLTGAAYNRTFETIRALRLSLAASRDEAEKAKKNEATCHCGSPMSAHGMGEGHSPVEMPEECPYAAELAALRADKERMPSEIAQDLCEAIEQFPASEAQTALSVKASAFRKECQDYEDTRPLTDHEKRLIEDGWKIIRADAARKEQT